MFRNVTDTQKSGIFAVLVLVIGVAFAATPLANSMTYMLVPTVTALVMMLAVTGEGCSKEGWKSLLLQFLLRVDRLRDWRHRRAPGRALWGACSVGGVDAESAAGGSPGVAA